MKFSSITVPAAVALLSSVSASESASESAVFKPFDKSQLDTKAFFEQFDSADWAQLWKISKAKRDNEFTYNGEWAVEEALIHPGFKNDKGLVLKTPAAHHAIHAQLPAPFINTDNTLVLQYEVKLQEGLQCGGAYVKLLSSEGLPDEDTEFNNDSSYQVMFGPDKCGTTNKVHLIIRRKDKLTGEYEEKHLAVPPTSRVVKTTTLYTLIIEPNQEYQIRINGDIISSGNLLDKGVLKPSLNPPKEIPDNDDTKPEDWEDETQIPDPDQAVKPEDWDEDAPRLIPDPKQTEKPSSWDEDAPEYIADPKASKPEDWDDEEDGEWVAPTIPNPECEEHGCGKWTADLVENPDYKGKWVQPLIKNPNYKGEWEPRSIPNPEYYEDSRPSDLEAIGGIGFELWSMQNNILFDNIYLGHSIEEAELIGNATFIPKIELEQEAVVASTPKDEEEDKPKSPEAGSIEDLTESPDFVEDWLNNAKQFIEEGKEYLGDFLEDPLATLSERPIEGGLYAVVLITFTSFILSVVSFILRIISGSPSAGPLKEKASESEKIEEIKEAATSTGVESKEFTAKKVSEK